MQIFPTSRYSKLYIEVGWWVGGSVGGGGGGWG